MKKTLLFVATVLTGLNAFAIPDVEGRYNCKLENAPNANSAIITLKVMNDSLLMESPSIELQQKPLRCENMTRTQVIGGMTISLDASCDDRVLAHDMKIVQEKTTTEIKVSVEKTSATTTKISVNTKIIGVGASAITLLCEK